MEKAELIELLKRYEWNDIEFKRAQRGVPNSAYETVSAFSNTEGGWLVFGIRDRERLGRTDQVSDLAGSGVPGLVTDQAGLNSERLVTDQAQRE